MTQAQGDPRVLEGRRALVVGGSGGIGRAVSLELGVRGAYVIVHGGSSRERLDSALGELKRAGARAEGFLLELGSPAADISRLAEALPSLGDIDILVAAFGPFARKSLAETSVADWERLALLNLALPGALASVLLPAMAARGWGRILLFGGTRTDGTRAYLSNAAYAAAKTGLAVLAKSLAAEGASRGVGCVLVCPGFVDTEYLGEPERDALRSRAPGGRLISAREIAATAVDLLAAEPCLASGAAISLDGGLSF
jgi:NAD(P)-dependent dehydrogenase (short-subunit alcohol dehydrogenase family)